MSKAYLETAILTNILLKHGSALQASAKSALKRYDRTLLPVYAIKEWKAGPLEYYAYVHNKLLLTKSLAATIDAINAIPRMQYRMRTSLEALATAIRIDSGAEATTTGSSVSKMRDRELATRYRLVLATLIKLSWRRRRRVADETVQDLACYVESEPYFDKHGLLNLDPKQCERDSECCLAAALKARPDLLTRLRNSIPEESSRVEDRERRKVLKELIKRPAGRLDRDQCRRLGDAVFAFFCPTDAVILTTNIRDHVPLAASIGKKAEAP